MGIAVIAVIARDRENLPLINMDDTDLIAIQLVAIG